MKKRLFVQKKPSFSFYKEKINQELKDTIQFQELEVFVIYDLYNINKTISNKIPDFLIDPVTDTLFDSIENLENNDHLAVESLPGQYDQRADSAEQCFHLLGYDNIKVKTGFLYVFHGLEVDGIEKVKKLLINPIESQIKDLNLLAYPESPIARKVEIIDPFIGLTQQELKHLYQEFGFSFDFADLEFIQKYFISQKRNPTETELKVLDTYWSDHCRHTTFETEISDIKFETDFKEIIQITFQYYLDLRKKLNIQKPICLMDLATIMSKYFIKTKKMTNIDVSEEINACTIKVEIDVDDKKEDWLLLFKNETHNHPTEVEPYGGASTCIGGAIRDPLSGRGYVYQAMRVTGCANPLETLKETRKGKLPQRKITQEAANGYSAYGNQIGVATTHVKEIYHPGYKAKRMEVGFVIGAVKEDWVRRETPEKGDVVLLIGGKTGRDGIGGATGSSKVHDGQKLSDLSAEVQKGNAPVERKVQRLFRNEEAIRLIKKCNDFGAGGISVAIGEIADGVHINLDKVPTKYDGLNGTELAISESQERMAVVVEKKDVARFIELAEQENLDAIEVAVVTDDRKIKIDWENKTIVELDRSFLDTNGVRKKTKITVSPEPKINPFQRKPFNEKVFLQQFTELNHSSQKGLILNFDSNVGRSTVLAPLAGKFQNTPEDVSVQKFPTSGFTNSVSMASFGFQPKISDWNPYYGGYYAVIESVAKIVAAGGNYSNTRLSFQEYFERLGSDPKRWGKPFSALLGTIEAQKQLEIGAIGGKDSMSGSFEEIHVPPTLISFAVCPNQEKKVRSGTLQSKNSFLYAFIPPMHKNHLLDDEILKNGFNFFYETSEILSAKSIGIGGLAETLCLMGMGNEIGFTINSTIEMRTYLPAAIVFETKNVLNIPSDLKSFIQHLGRTHEYKKFIFNDFCFEIHAIKNKWKETLQPIFPESKPLEYQKKHSLKEQGNTKKAILKNPKSIRSPKVLIPVFPGTNSEYDSEKAFRKEGASVEQIIIRNLSKTFTQESIDVFTRQLKTTQILLLPGGFSAADEPDGSGKFIASFLRNHKVRCAIHDLLDRKGLILGICNGFQALIKSGLLPYGKISDLNEESPILFQNSIQNHLAQMVRVKVRNDWSPWLSGMKGQEFWVPISHGEGRFMANDNVLNNLISKRQIATQYVDLHGDLATEMPYNPNGSVFSIEGITSPCGLIYGRMGHPERVETGTFKNIPNMEVMNLFKNAVNYFK